MSNPSTELLLKKYRVAFAALNHINGQARTLSEAQADARLAIQTCIDLGDQHVIDKAVGEFLEQAATKGHND